MSVARRKTENRYVAIIEKIFFDHWKKGISEFEFDRSEIKEWATKLSINVPDNVGDVIYSVCVVRCRIRSAQLKLAACNGISVLPDEPATVSSSLRKIGFYRAPNW